MSLVLRRLRPLAFNASPACFSPRAGSPVSASRRRNSPVAYSIRSMESLTRLNLSSLDKGEILPKKGKSKSTGANLKTEDSLTETEAPIGRASEVRPSRTRTRRSVAESVKYTDDDGAGGDEEGEDDEFASPKKRKRRAKAAVTETPKKRRRKKTPEEDRVYVIPPIENILTTTFKGRLGYACLNSLLRSYSTPVFSSRTCRLATLAELGHEHVRNIALQNVRDLLTLVRWNAEHGIFFLRMSSEMFPFASHPEHGYTLEFADKELKEVGDEARKLGVRLTSHPGQFTQLGSLRDVVVDNAIRDLKYHCEIMDRMGLDQDSVMIIHMGGTFGDKLATLARFRINYGRLPDNVKGRLVLENDEMCYNVDDLMPICKELNIPLVFDYHHDWIYPSTRPPAELIPEINDLWHRKGIKPKQHYSEPRPGAVTVMEKRAHSNRVARLPVDLPDDMDLMLECKDKEQAVFHLYRLYGMREVDSRVLRPPAEVETLRTNGRKSSKKKAKDGDKDTVVLEDAAIEEGTIADVDVEATQGLDIPEVLEPVVNIEREAEEHGIPLDDVREIMVKPSIEGDCGSGDDEVRNVGVGVVRKSKRRGSKDVRAKMKRRGSGKD